MGPEASINTFLAKYCIVKGNIQMLSYIKYVFIIFKNINLVKTCCKRSNITLHNVIVFYIRLKK